MTIKFVANLNLPVCMVSPGKIFGSIKCENEIGMKNGFTAKESMLHPYFIFTIYNKSMKILIVEDDVHIVSFLTRGFSEDGYLVENSTEGREGEYMATTNTYDIIILDWMLPGKSGIEILQSLRQNKIKTPIIMLTAKDEISDKVTALKKGADDYLTKPFAYEELRARVEALYRRSAMEGNNSITIQDITLDLDAKTIQKGDNTISLSQKEFELLLFLVKHKNSMVTTTMIEEQLWGIDHITHSNVVQVTIYHLRKKVGKTFIKSFRGMGYKIEGS